MNRQRVLCVLYRMCGERSLSQVRIGRSDMQYVLSTYCGVTDIDNDDHIITADDIEYINDGTVDDDLDVWMEMLEDYHENYLSVNFIIEILNFTTLLFSF